MMIQQQDTFPFLKETKIKCCVYIMHGEISESFPHYTLFICKFDSWNVFSLKVGEIKKL